MGIYTFQPSVEFLDKSYHFFFLQTIELRGEGGVYENEPETRDDVVRGGEESDIRAPSDAKWASSAKQRFMKDAEQRAKAVKSQVFIFAWTFVSLRTRVAIRDHFGSFTLPFNWGKLG